MVHSLVKFLKKETQVNNNEPQKELLDAKQSARQVSACFQPVFTPNNISSFGVQANINQGASAFQINSPVNTSTSQITSFISEEELKVLFNQWQSGEWAIMTTSDETDPLDILFNDSLIQWQIICQPQQLASPVYLVWKEQYLINEAAYHVYRDGQLIYKGSSGKAFDQFLNQDIQCFNYCSIHDYLKQSKSVGLQRLIKTIQAKLATLVSLKVPLFKALEQEIGINHMQPLEYQLINTLNEKVRLVMVFKTLVEKGLLQSVMDCHRLNRALKQLTNEFQFVSHQPQMQQNSMLNQCMQQYHQLLTDGLWRIRLEQQAS